MAASHGVLPWILVSGLVLTGLAFAAIKVIPEHERALVVRFGRVSRVGGPGVLAVLPVVERVVRICVRDSRMDSVVVRATTRDGVTVWITVAAYFSVVDPVRAYVAVPNLYARTAETIELVVRTEVERTDLKDLPRSSTWPPDRLLHQTNSIVAHWGTEVRHVEIVSIDLQLTAELLRWAERVKWSRDHVPRQTAG